ncbi:MAG: sugar transferase [Egibacteraceae bacterium]
MMRERVAILRVALMVSDFGVVVLGFVAASLLRFGGAWPEVWAGLLPSTGPVVVAFGVAAVGIFAAAGMYQPRLRWSLRTELHDLLRTGAILLALTFTLLYFFKLDDVSRWFLAVYFPLVALGLSGARLAVHLAFRWARSRGRGARNLLIAGSGPQADQFLAWCAAHPDLGIRVVGYLDDDDHGLGSHHRLGKLEDLPRVLADTVVDEVAICLPLDRWALIDWLAQVGEEQGKLVRIPMGALNRTVAKGRFEEVDGLPILSLIASPDRALALAVKRAFDLVGAALLLVATAPVLLLSAAAILVTEGRPILFRQPRSGLHGREFGAWKLRTMVPDAERLKAGLLAHNERQGPAFKLRHDPRVTRVGRWLRATSIDELPQLYNVLAGHMSLVGPRPADVEEVRVYDLPHRRRLSVRPGLTGLWQVTARDEPDFERWMELDLRYIDTWSLWKDLTLICRTPLALIRSPGA